MKKILKQNTLLSRKKRRFFGIHFGNRIIGSRDFQTILSFCLVWQLLRYEFFLDEDAFQGEIHKHEAGFQETKPRITRRHSGK